MDLAYNRSVFFAIRLLFDELSIEAIFNVWPDMWT